MEALSMAAGSCQFTPVFPYRPELKHKRPQVPSSPAGFPSKPKDWVVEFESFQSNDKQVQIFSHLFRAEKPSPEIAHRALIVLHGQGEHSGRYLHFSHYLQDTVGSIYLIDHRGHGQSTGIRGHVKHFDDYAVDAVAAIQRYHDYLMEKYGKAELHLLGHSMGGLIALRSMLKTELPIRSVILSAPMIELGFPVGALKLAAGRLLNKFMPFVPLPTTEMSDLVSHDPAVIEHYRKDPLNHALASPSFYFSYLEIKQDTLRRANELNRPILLLLPMADRVINSEATLSFFQKIDHIEKKLISYPGLFHEVFNEREKDRPFHDLTSWLKDHQA